jgi:hypothetical protein
VILRFRRSEDEATDEKASELPEEEFSMSSFLEMGELEALTEASPLAATLLTEFLWHE